MLASRIGRSPSYLIQKIKGAITDKVRSQVVSEDLCGTLEKLRFWYHDTDGQQMMYCKGSVRHYDPIKDAQL